MENKILIVDRVHESLINKLEDSKMICEVNMHLDKEAFISMPDNYFVLIIRSRFDVDKRVIDAKKNLRYIIRIGSGTENIDVDYARKKGITCISTPEGNANAVAEHCLGMLLAALRHTVIADREVREGNWLREKNKGTELKSYQYGIIGYGHTGSAFARLLHLLGCEVCYYDKYHSSENKNDYAEEVSLETLLTRCNVISLHINYSAENHYFFNEALINKVKQDFIFINSSRGLAVNTADLLKALRTGKIIQACLDVSEYENVQLKVTPEAFGNDTLQTLLSMNEKVILTPHIAGQTTDAEKRHAQIAFDKLMMFINK